MRTRRPRGIDLVQRIEGGFSQLCMTINRGLDKVGYGIKSIRTNAT
jgi:hypothetical protein